MTWVVWRQQRLIVLLSVGLALFITALAAILWWTATSYLAAHGLAGCREVGPGCDEFAMDTFVEIFGGYTIPLTFAMFAVPPLLGAFTGGPLFAREFEHRTHVFGLTQSVGRGRWWLTKILVGVAPVLAAVLVLGLVMRWTMEPLAAIAQGPLTTPGFETRGVALVAYTLLAFAIGSTAGILIRNTLGAMAIAIIAYILLLVPVGGLVRPNYQEPVSASGPATEDNDGHVAPLDSWPLDHGYLDADGKPIDWQPTKDCNDTECMKAHGVTTYTVKFHPPSRFWRFQLTESALFTGVSVLLIGVGGWVVRRRLP